MILIKKELDYSILWQLLVTQKREVTKEEVGMKNVFWTFFRLKFTKTHLGGGECIWISPFAIDQSQIPLIYDKLTVGILTKESHQNFKVNQTTGGIKF